MVLTQKNGLVRNGATGKNSFRSEGNVSCLTVPATVPLRIQRETRYVDLFASFEDGVVRVFATMGSPVG